MAEVGPKKRKLHQESEDSFVRPDLQDDASAPSLSLSLSGNSSTRSSTQATMHDDRYEHDLSYSDWREALPSHPAFSSKVESMESGAINNVLELQIVLENYAKDSKNLQDLRENATSAIQQCPGPKNTVACLGDTGSGKSSTINSLTGIPGLAVANAAGQSCTKVVTLYMHELPFQSNNFAAEIRYCDPETRKKLLEEQLKDYFRYTYEYDEDWEDWQQMEYENACQTAFKIFRSLFCDKSEFESTEAGSEFLKEAYYRSDDKALDLMEEWCMNLLADMMTEDGAILRFQADNVDDLHAELSPHVSEHHDFKKPALCHLIKTVTTGAREARILQYLTLADLPGTSDVDQVRAAIAQQFLQQCDAVLIFEPMARCADHPSAERNIATNAELFGTNMALVVTRSDDSVDEALAQSMCKNGQNVNDYFCAATQIKQLDSQLAQINRKIEKRMAVKGQNTKGSAFAGSTLEELFIQQSELNGKRRQHRQKQLETLVCARNAHTKVLLQRDKQRLLRPDEQLTVHCVSNTHYIAHLHDTEPEGTLLDVNATGIPALRAWLLGIAAPSLLLAIEERIGKCSTFVHGVAMWAYSAPKMRKAGILEVARAPELRWPGITEDTLRSIESKTEMSLFSPLQTRLEVTVEAALRYYDTLLSTWHPSTQRAFILKGGKHSTKRQRLPTCWNEKFISSQTKDVLDPNWSKSIEGVQEELEVMVSKLIDELSHVPKKLEEMEFMAAAQMANVTGIINQYIGRIRRAHALRLKSYDKELRNIKQNASFDVPTAYFTQAMRPMYEKCRNMRGTGSTTRMMNEMADHLSGKDRRPDPFTAMHDSLRSDVSRANNRAVSKLQSDVAGLLHQLVRRFDAVEHETPEEKTARQTIMPALATALADMERIDKDLKALKEGSNV